MNREHINAQRAELRMDTPLSLGQQARLSGRVSRTRVLPRIVFVELLSEGRLAQLAARVEEGEVYSSLQTWVAGDWVEVEGQWQATQSGDRALFCHQARVLAHCEVPFPAWFDPMQPQAVATQPDLATASDPWRMQRVRHRFQLFSNVRRRLESEGFMEVVTPILSSDASGAAATPFVTECHALGESLALRVAPENQLIRLLAGGFERIFEMGPSFRNEGLSVRHNPEFWLMEAYGINQSLEDVMALSESIAQQCFEQGGRVWQAAQRWTIEEALAHTAGLSLAQMQDASFLREGLLGRGIVPDQSLLMMQWQWFDAVEELPQEPFFILSHPVEMSPLAAEDPTHPGLSLRFELYADGVEIGNGYEQLQSAVVQAERFLEQAARQGRGMEAMSADSAYLQTLQMGLPRVSGFGLGLDRLAQISAGARSLREMLPFALTRHGGA